MARIKYSSIVSSVSGSVGSATFQKSSFGDILRNKPRARKSATALQLDRRQTMKYLHSQWSQLTNDQRRQWNQFIGYSQAKIRRDAGVLSSGHSLFLQYNFLRMMAGYPVMTSISYIPMRDRVSTTNLQVFDLGTLQLNVELEFPETESFFVAFLSPPRKPSLSFSRQGLRMIPINHDNEVDFDITDQYTSLFGALPAVGDTIHFSIRVFSSISPILGTLLSGTELVFDGDI